MQVVNSPKPANSILSRASFANGDERYCVRKSTYSLYNPDEEGFDGLDTHWPPKTPPRGTLDERLWEGNSDVGTETGWDDEREDEGYGGSRESRYDAYACSLREEIQRLEEEVRRKEEEVKRKEEEVKRKDEEAKKAEQQWRKRVEEAKRMAEEARRKEREIKRKEQDANRKIEDANKLVMEARREINRKEDQLRRKEKEDAEKTRTWQQEANRIAEQARLKQETLKEMEEEIRRKEQEIEERELALKAREEDLKRREDEARNLGEHPRGFEAEAWRKKEDEISRKEEQMRRKEEKFREDVEKTRRLQQEANRVAEQARLKQETLRQMEEETKRKEQEIEERQLALKEREEDLGKLVEEARRIREEARRLDEEAWRTEEEARVKEVEARRREERLREKEEKDRRKQEARKRDEGASRMREDNQRRESDTNQFFEENLFEDVDPNFVEEQARLLQQAQYHKRAEEIRRNREERLRQDFQSSFLQFSNSQIPRYTSPAPNATAWTTWRAPSSKTPNASSSVRPASTGVTVNEPRNGSTSSSSNPTSTSSRFAIPISESEWARRHAEFTKHQHDRFRREQEKRKAERLGAGRERLSLDEIQRIFKHHDRLWSRLPGTSELTWVDFPWPVLRPPSNPDDISFVLVNGYFLFLPETEEAKPFKKRIKEHLRRWYPDRFESQVLPRVLESEREKVKQGIRNVDLYLRDLLRREVT